MTNYVGLDVSQKTTTLCIVDGEGHRQWRGECVTSPEHIAQAVLQHAGAKASIGIETGPMTPWLVHELTPGCETGDDEQGERALAGRMRYANGCEADQCRDHAGAQSRRRVSRGPAAPDRSSPAAWLSGWPALGLAKGGLAAISARDLVDPVAVHLLRAELEALAHHAGKKTAHRVRLPAGGLHHRFDRCACG
jgi:hypothetical protein